MKTATPQQTQLGRTLDSLNAFGVLEAARERPPKKHLCFGPQAVYSRPQAKQSWAGAVIWYRPPGYHRYQTLDLLGIWAHGNPLEPEIVIGTRQLDYTGHIYSAESYFRHLQVTFETYYGKDAPPPAAARQIYTATYQLEARLKLRREVEAALLAWWGQVPPPEN